MSEYLEKVLIYLKQELPPNYRECIFLKDDKFEISVPGDVSFNSVYEELHKVIDTSINRVRVRKIDLEFCIKSKYQQREFKILKGEEPL